MTNQPEPSLRNSEIHLALLAWKRGDITMVELKKILETDKEAAVRESKEQLLLELAEVGEIHHSVLDYRLEELTHPQAGEGEGK